MHPQKGECGKCLPNELTSDTKSGTDECPATGSELNVTYEVGGHSATAYIVARAAGSSTNFPTFQFSYDAPANDWTMTLEAPADPEVAWTVFSCMPPELSEMTLSGVGVGYAYAPVPEPSTAVSLAAGLAALAAWRQRAGERRVHSGG